jgi:hypothetical protein
VERLENAAQNVVAVAQLYAEEDCTDEYGHRVSRLPPELRSAMAKINNILAGPGPVALDRRPNSVEVINDPVLHEKALLEARARETQIDRDTGAAARQLARGMVSDQVLEGALVYEERQHAQNQDIHDAFEEGKTQGYAEGQKTGYADAEHAYDKKLEQAKRMANAEAQEACQAGHEAGVSETNYEWFELSFWQLLRRWWRGDLGPAHKVEMDTMTVWHNGTAHTAYVMGEGDAGLDPVATAEAQANYARALDDLARDMRKPKRNPDGLDPYRYNDPYLYNDPGAPKDPCSPSQ